MPTGDLPRCASPWPPRAPWWRDSACSVYPPSLPDEAVREIEEHASRCADLEILARPLSPLAPLCIGCWGLGTTPFGRCLLCGQGASDAQADTVIMRIEEEGS